MFSEILEDGVRWSDGTVLRADVILWCTRFRSALDHLEPLNAARTRQHNRDRQICPTGCQGPEGSSGWLRVLSINHRRESRRHSRGKGAKGVSWRGEEIAWLRTSVATTCGRG